MHPTPRMPVEEHRRRLGSALFQIANGFGQVMRGVADIATPLAGIGPVSAEAVDLRRDTRPEADSIFNLAGAAPGPERPDRPGDAREHRGAGEEGLAREG